mmetsp:Transcript_12400/g.43171  ORF Transcript_12400/g.43171 Transcript_12400/m.43171 type:complete len:106 (-) Transcript_12400:840-1157(-)
MSTSYLPMQSKLWGDFDVLCLFHSLNLFLSLRFRHLEINVREGDPLTLLQLVNGIKFIKYACSACHTNVTWLYTFLSSIIQMRGGSIYVHCRLGRVRCVMLCVVG